ncbi:MAG: chorismate synthase [Candidatus Marinimicrobia bacterium]|mgnify:CR=1 FL=1|jgi:chorismate synthase|nr:chorismate synthase [Candidatus Neomarinimicrobiota bacterium]MBT3936802.1 chorismate synthase [Candidatus Neomarinimicrobiota bacterium]MBT3962003.1 chorismate synthase [Candidatus Neomarinimicrobiota bacterium]MBT4383693.1 chorismate synthase [Candidatus Neomarinimicrobiota bacterium]MBT4637168.1 chorismate synthase [Candidatus Neomarinimicrobiota bacterium]
MLKKLTFLTAGESHGRGLLGILDGIPASLDISENEINIQLARRQMGHGRGGRMKIETDKAEIWSGVRHGKTLGSPIGILIQNKDWENWTKKMSVEPVDETIKKVTLPRPGHADLAGIQKYGFDDIRNVLERSSARETTMRVALGSICRKLLEEVGIQVASRVTQIHSIKDDFPIPSDYSLDILNKKADESPVRCLDKNKEVEMINCIDDAKTSGDSLGGIFEVIATGLPYGLGAHTQWDKKLQTRISSIMMSVNAFKGIEIGNGFSGGMKFGSEVHDEIGWDGNKFIRHSNNAGGIEGGMSNAQPIVVRMAMKPIPTLMKPLRSVDIESKENKDAHKERTDACAVPAAAIIAESMLCFVLADALLEKFGGDSIEQLKIHISSSAKY